MGVARLGAAQKINPEEKETGGQMNELALFAGAGGGILGGKLLGWRTVCAVEINEYCRKILMQRQDDGILDPFPIWDDVRTFDGTPWRGIVDVVSGGFPCQDISVANRNAKGIDGERSGLWREMARIVGEVGPRYVFVENSPMLVGRGLAVVLGDLATMGYDARWGVFGAYHAGLPHGRNRLFLVAHTREIRPMQPVYSFKKQDVQTLQKRETAGDHRGWPEVYGSVIPAGLLTDEEATETGLVRKFDGLADWMDRVGAIGNGQVPAVVKLAWDTLTSL